MGAINDIEMQDALVRAERGDSVGLYYYIHGLAERGQIESAVKYAEQKHLQGRSEGLAYLADAIYSPEGPRPDPSEWRRLLTIDANGASSESAESSYCLGIECMDRDQTADAVTWLKRAGELGFQEAWVALGNVYLGDVDPPDPVEAMRCFVRCREGDPYPYTVQYPEDAWPLTEDGIWSDAGLLGELLSMGTPGQSMVIRQIHKGLSPRAVEQ